MQQKSTQKILLFGVAAQKVEKIKALCIGVLSCRITVFVLLFITAGALCHRFAHHHGIISRRVQ